MDFMNVRAVKVFSLRFKCLLSISLSPVKLYPCLSSTLMPWFISHIDTLLEMSKQISVGLHRQEMGYGEINDATLSKRAQVVVMEPGQLSWSQSQYMEDRLSQVSYWNTPKVCNFFSDFCSTTHHAGRHAQLVLINSHSVTFCVLKVHFPSNSNSWLSISIEQILGTNECLAQIKM